MQGRAAVGRNTEGPTNKRLPFCGYRSTRERERERENRANSDVRCDLDSIFSIPVFVGMVVTLLLTVPYLYHLTQILSCRYFSDFP